VRGLLPSGVAGDRSDGRSVCRHFRCRWHPGGVRNGLGVA
jgi:hypothetical protein